MPADELTRLPARRLAALIRGREVSAVEVVEAHLRRIDEVNAALNAVVRLVADRARAEARRADDALRSGAASGPLHGVPMTVKDSFDTESIVTAAGTPGRAGHVPRRDATAVARLRAAGAIVLGKTNTPELTFSFGTDNPVYGPSRNPYDPARSPGGSSGGAAAIIAAGGSPLDLGSDTAGSIRVPAHFCGIAGLKPTAGRVPRTGHVVPPGGPADRLTQVGPMARFVDDLALLLPLLAGPDPGDPASESRPLPDPAEVDVSRLRIAWYADNGVRAATPETAQAVRDAAAALAGLGAAVVEERPPAVETGDFVLESLFYRDGGAWILELLKRSGTPRRETSIGWVRRGERRAAPPPAEAAAARRRLGDALARFADVHDAIVAPVTAAPAPRQGDYDAPAFSYTSPYNVTGWPVAVVRAGTSPQGLPIGVQIAAAPWREDVALALAAAVEAALGGWRPPPEPAIRGGAT